MKRFSKGQRVVIRGLMGFAGIAGEVITFPQKQGVAWVRLDREILGHRTLAVYPYECDPEEKDGKLAGQQH